MVVTIEDEYDYYIHSIDPNKLIQQKFGSMDRAKWFQRLV